MTAEKNNPTPEAIHSQMERILQSAEFRASDKQRKFLSFVVDETLADRSSQLKGYTVAVSVYGRPEGFDPQVDPIVRVEAGRLRRALDHYYLTAGKNDPVHIKIPKGSYVPTFDTVQDAPSGDKTPTSKREASVLTTEPSIAVMPLTNLTGDREQDYFVDGLTEELTAELTRFQDFQVIATQSAMRFKGQNFDPREVGRDLGVQFLLKGSVRRDSKTVKVTIQLLYTATAEQIWGESYKRDQTATDLIAVQEEIAHEVIGVVADQYGLIERRLSSESRKKAPADLKTYDAVLRFYQYETELTPAAFEKALTALEQAIEIDPEYGLAWAMFGHLHADNHALGFCEIEASLEKALTFAQKGVALAPENQFAQDALTLVYFHRGDKELFLKHAEETIALNPNSPYIVGVAGWHMALYGQWNRGLILLQKGMQLNPYHPSWFHLAFFMDYYRLGEYEHAFAEALKFNFPGLYLDPMMRAAALGRLGRRAEAKAAVGQLLKLEPDFATRGRWLISRYVKVDDLVDRIIEGLEEEGLADIE
jgi:adenylate cyclase